ncbi:MAG TPA: multicopper oxidase domain-containing protein, partial [Patescibacteria group bacterium]|nr:multicopper oxidase domain-containing protein [Patescibacteria group bacterium]
EVVVLLHDFSFTDPSELLSKLTGMTPMDHATMHHGGQIPATSGMDETAMHQMHMQMMQSGDGMSMQHGAHGHEMTGMAMSHPNDVEYDAYLANDRTLDDPEVTRVEPGGRVRLRIINGATTTAFFIEMPGLLGQIVAVDGNAVKPVPGSSFPIGMGQRLDIVVTLPRQEGAWPILARREGDTNQTGIILATRKATIGKIASLAKTKAGIVSLDVERKLSAQSPLTPRPADRRLLLSLEGGMMGYKWTLNGAAYGANTPLPVSLGQRVELTFMNHSDMMHPMHLHGHHYHVIAIGGQSLAGAMRDTVMVPSMTSVTVAFDADNPGEWVLHCHNLFHMAAGMMTTVKYV